MTDPISAQLRDGEARFLKWAYKEHFDGPPVISIPRHPDNIDALLAEAADHIDAQAARIVSLEAAIKRQAGAAKTLRHLTLSEVQHLQDKDRTEYVAGKTLESERAANAMLTDELDAQAATIKALTADLKRMSCIEEMLAAGQGDDEGMQILPDFDPDMDVVAKVESCLHLLERRRDTISGYRAALAAAKEPTVARPATVAEAAKVADLRFQDIGNGCRPSMPVDALIRDLESYSKCMPSAHRAQNVMAQASKLIRALSHEGGE